MDPRMPFRIGAPAAIAVLLCLPASVRAQTPAPKPVTVFVSANAGLVQPAAGSFANVAFVTDGVNRDEGRADYTVERGPGLDIGGGVIIGRGLLLGLAVSHYTDSQPADFTLTLQHPQFHPTLIATTTTAPLKRTENAVHLQFGYAVPSMGRLHVMAFGGPSHFSLRQPLIVDLTADEVFSPVTRTWSAVVSNPLTENQRGSAWGYHAGADVSVGLTKAIGVGTLIRYSRATVAVDDPLQSQLRDRDITQDLDVGGLQISGGVRVRF